MSDPKQLDILKKMTAHLEAITVPQAMTGLVYRGHRTFGEDQICPFLNIIEHLDPDIAIQRAGENDFTRTETWILLIQGFVYSAAEQYPTDEAYILKANVESRLYRLIATVEGDPQFPSEYLLLGVDNGVISDIAIGPGVVSGPREGVSDKAFFYLPVGITLITDLSDLFV